MEFNIKKNTKSVWENLIEEKSSFPSFCGGRGNCGKCKILVTEGELPITIEDRKLLTQRELEQGYRLACRAYPQEDIKIEVMLQEERELQGSVLEEEKIEPILSEKNQEFFLAIDLGSTTIAMALLQGEKIIDTYLGINHQRKFGTDVISRMEKAKEGFACALTETVREDIYRGICSMLKNTRIECKTIKKIILAGNTVMEHLFFAYPTEGMEKYPFIPFWTEKIEKRGEQIFKEWEGAANIIGFPCLSAFIGGDILAGLYQIGAEKKEKIQFFLDLGTNGEMAVCYREKIYTASVAAGPVFEGGNISFGIGSVEGAICSVELEEENFVCKTIKEGVPIGICGTGLIEAVAVFRELGLLEKDGKLKGAYTERGVVLTRSQKGEFIVITQKDIREFQLAKGAILAGIQLLLKKAQLSIEQIEEWKIAGSFGKHLNIKKAVRAGLLPRGIERKCTAVGNTSLYGTIKYGREQREAEIALKRLKDSCEYISLAEEAEFQKLFLESLAFE